MLCTLVGTQGSLVSQVQAPEGVKIGLVLAAVQGDGLRAQDGKRGVELAVAQANGRGGVAGRMVSLLVRHIRGPWGSGSKAIVDLVFQEDVQALIGSLDGRSAHLVVQLAAKSRTPFLTAWATDPTLSRALVPWFFRLVPDDRQQAAALVREIYRQRELERVALVAAETYDARMAAGAFARQVDSAGLAVTLSLTYGGDARDREAALTALVTSEADAVVLLGPAAQSLDLIRQMRVRGVESPVFGTLSLSDVVRNGRTIRGLGEIVVPDAEYGTTVEGRAFTEAFRAAYRSEPGAAAAYAYDATRVLLSAIEHGGPGRASIRQSLGARRPAVGVTGEIRFDRMGNRLRPVKLVALRGGRPQP